MEGNVCDRIGLGVGAVYLNTWLLLQLSSETFVTVTFSDTLRICLTILL